MTLCIKISQLENVTFLSFLYLIPSQRLKRPIKNSKSYKEGINFREKRQGLMGALGGLLGVYPYGGYGYGYPMYGRPYYGGYGGGWGRPYGGGWGGPYGGWRPGYYGGWGKQT